MNLERLTEYDAFLLDTDRIFYDDVFNCRGPILLSSVETLAEQIRECGMLVPIIVQPACDVADIPEGFDWRVVAGHRRLLATAKVLKRKTIAATIRDGLSAEQAGLLNFMENLERKDLNPLQEALAIERNFPADATTREIGLVLKRDVHWVHSRRSVLKMPDDIRMMVASKRVSLLDMETIRGYPEDEWQAVANAIAAAKKGGGKPTYKDTLLIRRFKRRRTKDEIGSMMGRLLKNGFKPADLIIRFGAWCAGKVSDAEFLEDLKNH